MGHALARRFAAALIVALSLASPAMAQEREIATVPVSIPATQPDESGGRVVLDGGVTMPVSGCPCPGVILNHGFLGKWTDSRGITERLAREGYVVLRCSSRGFGKTPGKVDLMGPKESQDLLDAVHWLNNPHSSVVGGRVVRDRIGQFGGSYGGAHAWALARSGDPAVRTVIPAATWNDLADALLPSNVMLLAYANGFYASGFGPTGALINGALPTGASDNYSTNVHRWMAAANTGVGLGELRAGLRARSIVSGYDQVKIPVFIVQGLNDGLFSGNQAINAYEALRSRGVPARLYMGGLGHPPSDASLDSPEARHVGEQALAWFDHYLKGVDNGIDRAAPIELSRVNYFDNRWDGTTRSAARYPFGPAQRMHLCTNGPRGGTLSTLPCPLAKPAVVVNSYASTGYDEEPVTAGYAKQLTAGLAGVLGFEPDLTTAPPALVYDTPVLRSPLELAGVPKLRLRVAAADVLPADADGALAAFQLDPKLYDVAPDGTAKLLTRGAFAEPLNAGKLTVPAHNVDIDVFALSNRIDAGHRLRVVLVTADILFLRPTTNPFAAALFAGSAIELPSATDLR